MTTDRRRRQVLTASLGAAAVAGMTHGRTAPAAGYRRRRLDLSDPKDSLYAVVKLRGDHSGAPVLQCYSGSLTLQVAGELPRLVARYQGLIRTTWTPQADGSFRYRTFDVGFFGDPDTGRPVESLTNPVTGARLEPLDVRDGPVTSHYTVHGVYRGDARPDPTQALSLPWRSVGDELWYEASFGFEYPNPLPPAAFPELSSTDVVTQRSAFTYKGRRSELEDADTSRAPLTSVMVVTSTIHPWLKMGRYRGTQMIHTVSHKITGIDQAPAEVREYVERHVPGLLVAETPFTGAGNSFERYRRERLAGATAAAAACGPRLTRRRDAHSAVKRWRHYVDSRFGQLHVTTAAPRHGDLRSPPLVCLHPSPTTGEMYADLQAELATDRVVHCPDTPGYGASDAPPEKPTIMDYGAALADAIAALGHGEGGSAGGPVDLFGFHTGSLCAIEVALQCPGLVRRVVLSGVPHYPAARREQQRRQHVTGYPYFDDPEYVARMFRRLVLDASNSGTPEQRLRRFGDRLRAGANGWWGPDAVFTYDSVAALPRLGHPTLLIAFDEAMTEPTRQAARVIPNARLVEMLDLPIFGFIVDPVRVAAEIRGFLDAGVEGRPAGSRAADAVVAPPRRIEAGAG